MKYRIVQGYNHVWIEGKISGWFGGGWKLYAYTSFDTVEAAEDWLRVDLTKRRALGTVLKELGELK